MAKFPTTEARQELGVTPTTAVRARIDTRTGEGLAGAAIGQAVVAGVEEFQRRSARKEAIEDNRQKMLDIRSSITADSFITTAINENVAFRNTNADTATWPKDLQERLSGVESQIGTLEMSDDSRLLVDTKFKAKSQEALSRSLIAETDRDKTDTRDAIIANVVEQVTNGTLQDQKDAIRNFSEIALTLMDKNEARATLKTAIIAGQKARGEKAIENIKPGLIAAITERNKREDGYEVLNAATAQLAKDGILTKPEAAEANKVLGDWIDNYVAGRIKTANEADKLSTIQSYQELSKPIVNGELTYDDIDESDLRQTRRSGESVSDAERWRKYIKGSYKDAPTKNTPGGHTISFAAVYDVATLQLSPKEGYDVLLESRFVDGSITNKQFEWAVDKIENPYPRHVLENLKATLKSNLEDFNRLFSSDKERNKEVNEALLSWADVLIGQDKAPSKKEMFVMSSAFRAGSGQPYDIGRIIERGGREWEIIGFDSNGEPLVEEIP